jgi:acylphosphatase
MAEHYKLKVSGRVQGVFFRVSTQREATRLELTGFVCNESDGSVYIEVEGQQVIIENLISWISKGGPPQGRVDKVDVQKGALENFNQFEIR